MDATSECYATCIISRNDDDASQQPSPDQCLPHFHFVSHTTEMDYLKSEAISPKICRIRFCDSVGDTKVLLTANGILMLPYPAS